MSEINTLADLKPDQSNARKHNPRNIGMISKAIGEVGVGRSIVIDEEGNILAGNGTVEALAECGITDVRVIKANGNELIAVQRSGLTEEQKKKLALYDNRTAELADWDVPVLKELEIGLPGLLENMFLPLELDELLDLSTDSGFQEGEDDAPEPPEEPVTKPGDIYILDEHRLMCGDSIGKGDVFDLMNGERAQFCFTSPPYLAMRDYGGCDLNPTNLKTFISVAAEYCDFFAVNLGIARKDGTIVRYWDDYIAEAESVGLPLSSWNVWDKQLAGSIGNQSAMFPIHHEWIFIFGCKRKINRTIEKSPESEKRRKYFKKDKQGRPIGQLKQADGSITWVTKGFNHAKNVLSTVFSKTPVMNRQESGLHPAVFPVQLPEEYIRACSSSKDIIYEPFAGSGSTLIACEKLGRKCYMMEIDPSYCDVIVKRWEEFTGKNAELIKGVMENG